MGASLHCCFLWRSCVSWPAVIQKEQDWAEPDRGWESFTAWCIAEASSSKPLLASPVLSHGSQERAQHTCWRWPQKTDIQCRCWLKIKEQRKKYQRTTEDRSGTLHVCIWLAEPFSSRSPPSLPAHTLEKQITGTSLSFLTLSAPSFPVLTLENRWATALPRSTFSFLCCMVTKKVGQRQEGFWNVALQHAK